MSYMNWDEKHNCGESSMSIFGKRSPLATSRHTDEYVKSLIIVPGVMIMK